MNAISDNMRVLKDKHGFDTVAAREACLRLAGSIDGNNVLDIGTGSGWMAIVLAKHRFLVTSVDIALETTNRARERAREQGEDVYHRIRFVVADALHLPFAHQFFDAVFSFDSMHHMPDCQRVLNEMKRVCKVGGVQMIADLNFRGLAAVRQIAIADGNVSIQLVLTAPGCPLAGWIIHQIRQVVSALPGVQQVEVELLDEPWQPSGDDWQAWLEGIRSR